MFLSPLLATLSPLAPSPLSYSSSLLVVILEGLLCSLINPLQRLPYVSFLIWLGVITIMTRQLDERPRHERMLPNRRLVGQ